MALKKKKKKAKPAIEMTLWGVILSYPDLHEPKPYKGKIYYRTDVLMETDHPQLKELRNALKQVKIETFGEDETEWPETGNPYIMNGDEREDSVGYKGRKYISASTQTPVPVVDPKGKSFNPQMVKGGMYANVAIRISAWEYDGDIGVSIYLQGVQIDTSKPSLNFGGGKSVKQMFKLDDEDEDDTEDQDEGEDNDEDEDEDDTPRKKKKKSARDDDDEDEDDTGSDGDDDENDAPRSSKKKKRRNFDEDEEE